MQTCIEIVQLSHIATGSVFFPFMCPQPSIGMMVTGTTWPPLFQQGYHGLNFDFIERNFTTIIGVFWPQAMNRIRSIAKAQTQSQDPKHLFRSLEL
jgi:hypothetical protein